MDGSKSSLGENTGTEITILGKSYQVRSDTDSTFTAEAADYVNTKMRELLGKSGSLATEKVAVLTAMNLAGELLKDRRESARFRGTLRAKAEKVLQLIDDQL